MFRNYLSIAYRSLFKNKAFSLLNIFGLATGMAAFLFIIHYVRYERSYENENPNADNIFRITLDLYNGNEYVVTDCEMYPAVGSMLKEKMPEVVDFVRMFHNDGLQDIEANNKKFLEEGIYYADPSAFEMFSLNTLAGEGRTALSNPFQMLLTKSTAKKYFGSIDVIGEPVKIMGKLYHVSAIIDDLPTNTHLKFNALLSHITLTKIYPNWYKEDSFNGNNEYTYLLMKPGTDLAAFNAKLHAFSVNLKDKIGDEKISAERIKDIHLLSTKSFEPEPVGNERIVNFLSLIAVFIIVIAWVNYINLSTARAVERAREVGIRKVMGSLKLQLVFQFLAEALMINMLAAVVAFIFFETALPVFRDLTGQPLPLNFASDVIFWYTFAGLLVTGSILSGLYPAFVLSSFQPSSVLKGKFKSSLHGQNLRKTLVIFQFGSTLVLLVGMVTVYLQIDHMRSQDLGMKLDQTLVIRAPFLEQSDSIIRTRREVLRTELARMHDVQRVAAAESLPGLSVHEMNTTSNVKRVGHESESGSYNYYYSGIDADLIPTLSMQIIAGNNFQKGMKNAGGVIINEESVRRLGFRSADEAVGSKITFRDGKGQPSTIVGVVRNFYQQSPKQHHIPMLYYFDELGSHFTVKLKSNNMQEVVASVQKVWHQVFPNATFHYFFLDEKYNQQYKADTQFGYVVGTFSLLAVFIACLGLFGLSAFTIVQRTKEIGIRKVLGASVLQIVHLLAIDFIKIVLIAAIVGLPFSYFAVDRWLSDYAVRIHLNVWMFMLPVIVIVLIALFTVSFQTFKTALVNPANSLKQE